MLQEIVHINLKCSDENISRQTIQKSVHNFFKYFKLRHKDKLIRGHSHTWVEDKLLPKSIQASQDFKSEQLKKLKLKFY